MNIGWLTLLWLLPALGSVAVLAIPERRPEVAKWTGLVVSAGVLAIAVGLAATFGSSTVSGSGISGSGISGSGIGGSGTGGERFRFVEDLSWIPTFGARYTLGLDGVGLVLVLLTVALVPLLLIAGWRDADGNPSGGGSQAGGFQPGGSQAGGSRAGGDSSQRGGSQADGSVGGLGRRRGPHTYIALFLAVEAMVVMSFVALDILLFYIVFEAMLIPMYFLIGGFGSGPHRASAAVKFLLYNLFGGLIMLAAVIGLYIVTSRSEIGATFSLTAISDAAQSGSLDAGTGTLRLLFLGFMFAFAVKAPLWPFHSWLPDAAVAGTPSTAVLMMAVVDKVGTFAMLRFCLELFPEASQYYAPLICGLAVVGIVYGAVLAIAQTDVMRLISYTSISHFGFIILGIFAMTSQSQTGATLYMVNHGISTAALFLIAGFLVSRRGSRRIANFGGVARVAPMLAGTFLVAGLATLSLPGLAPFISEFLVLVGSFTRYPVAAIIATSALVLSAIYILWTYQRMMGGPVRVVDGPGAARDPSRTMRDLIPAEITVVAPLLAALLVLGIYPKPLIDVIEPVVANTMSVVGVENPAPTVTAPTVTDPTAPDAPASVPTDPGGEK